MCEKQLLCTEIAYIQGLVKACEAYAVEPVAKERVKAVEKPYETVKEWTGYEYTPGSGSKPTTLDFEVRKYDAADPEGEDQLWRQRDYTEKNWQWALHSQRCQLPINRRHSTASSTDC